jgi:hypothetical protein
LEKVPALGRHDSDAPCALNRDAGRGSGFSDVILVVVLTTTRNRNTHTEITTKLTSQGAGQHTSEHVPCTAVARAHRTAVKCVSRRVKAWMCEGSVALDRVRVSSWSELAPRIPLKRIQLGRLGRGSQVIRSIHSVDVVRLLEAH